MPPYRTCVPSDSPPVYTEFATATASDSSIIQSKGSTRRSWLPRQYAALQTPGSGMSWCARGECMIIDRPVFLDYLRRHLPRDAKSQASASWSAWQRSAGNYSFQVEHSCTCDPSDPLQAHADTWVYTHASIRAGVYPPPGELKKKPVKSPKRSSASSSPKKSASRCTTRSSAHPYARPASVPSSPESATSSPATLRSASSPLPGTPPSPFQTVPLPPILYAPSPSPSPSPSSSIIPLPLACDLPPYGPPVLVRYDCEYAPSPRTYAEWEREDEYEHVHSYEYGYPLPPATAEFFQPFDPYTFLVPAFADVGGGEQDVRQDLPQAPMQPQYPAPGSALKLRLQDGEEDEEEGWGR